MCVVDADTLKNIVCDDIQLPMPSHPALIPVWAGTDGQLRNFRIMFVASGWNSGNGGMAAIDNIEYEGKMCWEVPPVTPPPTVVFVFCYNILIFTIIFRPTMKHVK
jgi:hypothetical protein